MSNDAIVKKEKKFNRRPNEDIRIRTSEDKKYIMVDLIKTWILPVNYIAAIVKNAASSPQSDSATNDKANG